MKTTAIFLLAVAITLICHPVSSQQLEIKINGKLEKYTANLVEEFDQISQERKNELTQIGDFLISNISDDTKFNLLFVCTHNSRRSHIADVWFKYASLYYDVNSFESYSGGLEATAFNPNAIAALKRAGFTIAYNKKIENPVISITPGNFPVWQMKSKVYTHKINPQSDFAAIMVCSDADNTCPIVEGASGRFSLPYNDPRYFDNTPSEDSKYDETIAIIAREQFYLANYLKNQIIINIEKTN